MDSTGARDTFKHRLSELMRQHGTKQKELADALGVRAQTVSQYTTGRTTPDYDTLSQIARYYDVSLDWLLGMSEYQKVETGQQTIQSYHVSETAAEIWNMFMSFDNYKRTAEGLNLILENPNFYIMCMQISDLKELILNAPTETYDALLSMKREEKKDKYKIVLHGLSSYSYRLDRISEHFEGIVEDAVGLSKLKKRTEEICEEIKKKLIDDIFSDREANGITDEVISRWKTMFHARGIVGSFGADMISDFGEQDNEQCD